MQSWPTFFKSAVLQATFRILVFAANVFLGNCLIIALQRRHKILIERLGNKKFQNFELFDLSLSSLVMYTIMQMICVYLFIYLIVHTILTD